MLPVTPMRVHNHHDSAVVVGSDGELIGLDKGGRVTNILRPMSNPISSSILLDGHLIASWNFYDDVSSCMGLIPQDFFVDFGNTSELGCESGVDGGPAGATWWRKVEGNVESVGGAGGRFIFALSGQGIYSMSLKIDEDVTIIDESWRTHYPALTLSSGPEIRDRIASILITESGVLAISEGGEWILLSAEEGIELDRGFLDLRDPVYRAVYSSKLGTMVMTRGKEIILMDGNREIIQRIRRIPGPVLDGYADNGGWKWTGWRHDGSFRSGELLIRMRPEIGIGMFGGDKCICNDGSIEQWGGYSSESEVV